MSDALWRHRNLFKHPKMPAQRAQHSWQNGVIFDRILRGIFVNSMIMSEKSQILVSAHGCRIFFCHAGLGIMPKTKFRQARHASRGLPNWTKYYSILCRLSWSTRDITEIIIWTLGFDNELIADAQKVSKVKLVTLNLAVTKPMALFQKIESMLIRLSYNDRGAWSRYVSALPHEYQSFRIRIPSSSFKLSSFT